MINVVQVVVNDTSDKIITGIIEFDREGGGVLVIPSGSSLPASSASVGGEIFYKTDENVLYRRDTTNTTWAAVSAPVQNGLVRQEGNAIYFGTGSISGSLFAETYFGQRVSLTPTLIATGTVAAGGGQLAVTSSLSANKRYTFTAEVWSENTGSQSVIYAKGLLVKAHNSASTAVIAVNKTLDDDYSTAGCMFTCTSSAGDVLFTFINSSSAGLDTHIAVGWYEVNKP